MATLKFEFLFGTEQEIKDLQAVLEQAPEYHRLVTGGPASSVEAQNLYNALPENKTYNDKFVLGFYLDGQMVGCADLIRGYPSEETAMIGLLLFADNFQKKGHGKTAYEKIEELCLQWPEIHIIRIGILENNSDVLPFWKKLGFKENGKRVPYKNNSVTSEVIVLEKIMRSFN